MAKKIQYTEAFDFAQKAHADQEYKGAQVNEPYINHCARVADGVSSRAKIVAILHDCLEDAGKLPDNLSKVDRQALRHLTRHKGSESYDEYIQRIIVAEGKAGDIAREVKLADLRENLSSICPGHFEHLRTRYTKALQVLEVL